MMFREYWEIVRMQWQFLARWWWAELLFACAIGITLWLVWRKKP